MAALIEAAYQAWVKWHRQRVLLWKLGVVEHVIERDL
jgi:hypothetical protein